MLLDIINNKYKVVSIIGLAKNSGKTTTLNYLLSQIYQENISIGITSTGRDGESIDVLTEKEKPKIYAREGTIISTTTELLSLGNAQLNIIKKLDYSTPIGDVILARVVRQGFLQIAGPQSAKGIKEVGDMMLKMGVDMVIVDGAIDRVSSAAPTISEGTILTTGAVLSRDMDIVLEKTLHKVNLLSLRSLDIQIKNTVQDLMDQNQIAILDNDLNVNVLDLPTALGTGKIIGKSIKNDSKYLVIPGSLVKRTIEGIILSTKRYKDIEIIIKDGTKVFIDYKDWLSFKSLGVNVKVLDPIEIIAITINPYSPYGYIFDKDEFLFKMKAQIKNIEIMDVKAEKRV